MVVLYRVEGFFLFLAIFKNGTHWLFMSSFAAAKLCARAAKFLFSKNHRDLKKEKFKFVNIFLFLQGKIGKKKIWETIFKKFNFRPPKWA